MSAVYSLKITICDPANFNKEISFDWEVLHTPPALMWFKLLTNLAQIKKRIFPRFTGFISPHKKMSHLRDNLNQCIEIINGGGLYKIAERATDSFDQEFSNIIHHHFEILSGSYENPSDIYKSSNKIVRKAIAGLNQNIHDMEALTRANEFKKSGETGASALICEVVGVPRYKMPEDFLEYFSMKIEYGDIFLHYSQIGKTWWEVFIDQDQEIFPDAIRPLSVISGEFDAFFYDFKMPDVTKNQLDDLLIKCGQDPQNKHLALGYLPVAKFINTQKLSKLEIQNHIAEHLYLKNVSLYKNNSLIGLVESDYSAYDFLEQHE